MPAHIVRLVLLFVVCLLRPASVVAADETSKLVEVRRFPAAEAIQGVAVDREHFYAVTNRAIGKYNKRTGRRVAGWTAPASSPLKHLNSGVVVGGKLYAAHSNWPTKPLRNSVEIWDAATLKPVGRKAFTRKDGALTWIDRHADHWWIVFAYYGEKPADVAPTTLLKLDDKFETLASWRFPDQVLRRFVPFSNSGGSWGPGETLYVTGHDRAETYAVEIPGAGKTLDFRGTLAAPIAGQGIAWDRSTADTLFGIHRAARQVVVTRLKSAK